MNNPFKLHISQSLIETGQLGIRLLELTSDADEYEIALGGLSERFKRNNRTEIDAYVHTHLVEDGEYEMFISGLSRGQVIHRRAVPIEVRNASSVGKKVAAKLRSKYPVFVLDQPCDSSLYDYSDSKLSPWFEKPDAEHHISTLLAAKKITSENASVLQDFVKDGYAVLPTKICAALVARANKALDQAIKMKYSNYVYGESQRLEHMHTRWPAIHEICVHPEIHHYLKLIFEEEPAPCQSLVYIFGSQQSAHQDTIHLTPFPAGYMCGVWIALEDVKPNSGELAVYPGSHRLERVRMQSSGCPKVRNGDWSKFMRTVVKKWEAMIENANLVRTPYLPKAGDILIWHENLLHEGLPRIDKSISRRSIVTHHFAKGSLAYYDSSGRAASTMAKHAHGRMSRVANWLWRWRYISK